MHLVELDLHRALQVQQTARRRHHQIGVLQLGDLQLVRHAAHDVGDAQAAAMLDQFNRVVRYLLGQFAGRAHHQSAGRWRLEVAGIGRVLALGTLGGRLTLGGSFGHGTLEVSALLGFGICLVS